MSQYEQKPNTGNLFRNEDQRPPRQMKNDDGTEWLAHDPDYTGSADINGVPHFVDGYLRKSKAGRTYMQLKFKPKQQKAPRTKGGGLTEDNWDKVDFNDDASIPF